jgi:hypothetical protein
MCVTCLELAPSNVCLVCFSEGDGAECRAGGHAQAHAGRRHPEAAHLQPIHAQDQVDTHTLNGLGGIQVQEEWLSSTREGGDHTHAGHKWP